MNKEMTNNQIKALAAYLPQFHPIPENDKWWGKGFTEWTNVAKAKPLFRNHWQPRLPADLGFYDLRVPEARQAQAELAKQYGIHGFMYWHYWFGGKRIIERPFKEVVNNGKPDFPFCLAWANQTWKGTWHGLSNKEILIEQTYPGEEDHVAHFYENLEAFCDARYIEVYGKKLFFVFRPMDIPGSNEFVECWQNLAIKEGLKGFHFVGMHMPTDWNAKEFGYDAFVQNWAALESLNQKKTKSNIINRNLPKFFGVEKELPEVISYKGFTDQILNKSVSEKEYPLICVDWDNTPRSGTDGWLFSDFSLELFEEICYKAFECTNNKPAEEKMVLIKSWNEWAEGNYMEPDRRYGHGYLETFQNALTRFNNAANGK